MTTTEKDDKRIVFIQNDDNTFVDYFRDLHSRYRLDFRKANRAYKTNIASRVVIAVEKENGSFWLQEKGHLIELVTIKDDELRTILSEIIHGFYVLEAIRKGGVVPKRKETGRVTSLSKSIKKPEQVASSTARKPSPPVPVPVPVPVREEKKEPVSPPSPPEATGGRSSRRKRRPPKRTMPGESSSGESSNNTLSRATRKKKKRTKIPTPSEDLTHESSDASEPSVASRRPYHWQPPPPKEDMTEALAYFKNMFGHTCIPPNWAGHPELATWAALQRQVHRETCRGYRLPKAEEKEQLQQLDPIQELDWSVKDGYEKEQNLKTESVIIL
jgi:hypothetical protein